MRSAVDTIRRFWEVQDAGDYTALVELFARDARLVDPVFGTFEGRDAVAGFMAKMNREMASRQTSFRLVEVGGGGDVAWAQWLARTPAGDIEGVGVYRVVNGEITYYRDYMNAARVQASTSAP